VLEADVAIGDVAGGLEAAIIVVERPVVQVTGDQADAIAHLAAGQRHVQPVGGARSSWWIQKRLAAVIGTSSSFAASCSHGRVPSPWNQTPPRTSAA
jgi:hypothetical protein